MTKKILKALRGSIKKWKKIVNGAGVDKGFHNCPLCQELRTGTGCIQCPVSSKTSSMDCQKTPYEDWHNHQIEMHVERDVFKIYCPECRRLAKEELEFLKGLLPLRRRGLNENISKNK